MILLHCKPRTRTRSERANTRAHHTETLTAHQHSAHGTTRGRRCAPTAGAWAEHKGSFDTNFFRDFTTSPEGFQYKFVADAGLGLGLGSGVLGALALP
jgi:hypothetical protein